MTRTTSEPEFPCPNFRGRALGPDGFNVQPADMSIPQWNMVSNLKPCAPKPGSYTRPPGLVRISEHEEMNGTKELFPAPREGRGSLMGMSLREGQRVPGSKPDCTEDPSCVNRHLAYPTLCMLNHT
ncbi:hypothetical protein AVEN_112664-1 [Araneus ventricosus]|uniref:Uncharacterized protein n=1 Tax=Araneus ventricosus TaxID=182803 RepID=A0A4Y2KU80_ARAVE|nr:hypothetical protein AVEN_112664-1 [Araneus ventricosus]